MASAWRRASRCSRSASGRLRHQRPDAGVVGLVTEVLELLVDDPQLLAQGAQAVADLGEAAFDEGPVHEPDCTDASEPSGDPSGAAGRGP